MDKKEKILFILLILFCLSFYQCSDPISTGPPDIGIDELLAAPESLSVGSNQIILNTYLWRDFQPITPPDGKPLVALLYILKKDSATITQNVQANAVYIVNGKAVWKSYLTDAPPRPEIKNLLITKRADNGPKWGPQIYVDVIVRLTIDSTSYLLKAPHQYIGRTD